MGLTRFKFPLVFLLVVLTPSILLSALDEKKIPGTYKSKENRNNIIVLDLSPDHSALIVDKY